jgi:hypothetical protein
MENNDCVYNVLIKILARIWYYKPY